MSQSKKTISALLPVKNGEKYLDNLLPKILAMLASNDEIIIVNDGSTDRSQKIIEKYLSQDSRVTLVNTSGVGLVSALNLGVNMSKSTWIARFDVDDIYLDIRLQEQRRYLDEDVAVVFSDYQFISEGGKGLGYVYSAVLPIPTALSLISSQRTAHPSAIINRKLMVKAGGYRAQDFPAEDLALWLKISQYGKVISVPLPLLRYTLTRNSISSQNREIQQKKKFELIQKHPSWSALQEQSIKDFAQTIDIYRKTPHTPERILLHIRDLYLVAQLTEKKIPIFRFILKIRFLLAIRIIFSAFKLIIVLCHRRLFRFFQ